MPNASQNDWTPDRERIAAQCFYNGMSASEAARKIGGCTRSAVIGKWNRMGLKRGGPAAARTAEPPAPEDSLEDRLRQCFLDELSATETAREIGGLTRNAVIGRWNRMGLKRADSRKNRPVLQTAPNLPLAAGCRWPLGDPVSADFRFCGAPAAAGPYCDEHRKLALRPFRAAATE